MALCCPQKVMSHLLHNAFTFFSAFYTTFSFSVTLHYVNEEERKEGKSQSQLFFREFSGVLGSLRNGEWDVKESDKNLISREVQVIDVQNLKFLLD